MLASFGLTLARHVRARAVVAPRGARARGLAGGPGGQRCDRWADRAVPTCGALRRVSVYEAFVDGAKEGFGVAVQIIPYLIAILVAVGLFRASGCMQALMDALTRLFSHLGVDTAFVPALPVGLMKILSGAGARGLMIDVMNTYGVDSFQARLAAIIQGSTETTFYVLAVYFGSVNVRKTRHALACALFADFAGLGAAIGIAYLFR